MATKWGIICTGKICSDFVRGLNFLPDQEHTIVAVGASSEEKAKEFALTHRIPISYGSYDELAKDKNIEVVYVGAINSLHFPICKMLLQNGKHVLCEKPLCLNVKDTKALISISREKKLFLMEGVWSRCFPLYKELRSLVVSDVIGNVIHITANFGLQISEVPRLKEKELGGGTIFDLGVYVLQLVTLVFGDDYESLTAVGQLNQNGVDESVNYIITYKGGKSANLCTHSKIKMDNSAIIYGTQGYLKIQDPFWCPTVLFFNEQEVTFPLPSVNYGTEFMNSEGLIYEATEVRKCLNKGLLESPEMTHQNTLVIAQLQEEVCKRINAK